MLFIFEGRGIKLDQEYLNLFIRHIEDESYSEETIQSYEKVITQFMRYLSAIYQKNKEPFEVNPSDIKDYIQYQTEKRGKSISTANKELTVLKTFFNYLWEKDYVKVDPCVKIKRLKQDKVVHIDYTYEEITGILNKVLANPNYHAVKKATYLLATKGLKTSDFRFKKSDVSISKDKVKIRLKHRSIALEGIESECFLEYYYDALLNETDYIFTTKNQKSGSRGPVQVMTLLNHLRTISSDYFPSHAKPLTLVSIRKAIVYYLYTKENKPIQYIATLLGIEEISASNYIKSITFQTS